jgi:hypothetical protein
MNGNERGARKLKQKQSAKAVVEWPEGKLW